MKLFKWLNWPVLAIAGTWLIFILLIVSSLSVVGCKSSPTAPEVTTTSTTVQESTTTTTIAPPQDLVQGWSSSYDDSIKSEVSKYPSLLVIPEWRMTLFCPRWKTLSQDQRREFYPKLLWSMAGPESNRDRSTMYWEKTFENPDAVTKLPVVSEGLMQLSYQDSKWYSGCKFDYAKDKDKFIEDWNSKGTRGSWKAKNLDRTILVADTNLRCSVFIMQQILSATKNKNLDFRDTLGKYWAVMQKSNSFYPTVVMNLKTTNSDCF